MYQLMRKIKTLEKWKEEYQYKIGEEYTVPNGFKLFYYPDRGFCDMRVNTEKEMVIAMHCCGDLLFWRQCMEFLCKALGYHVCGTYTILPILPYLRLAQVRITGIEETAAGPRYYGKDKHTGQWALASPGNLVSVNGNTEYYITWGVN